MLLVVPMNPEFLPEAGLLIAGLFAGTAAVHFALTRQGSRALRAGVASLACIALALVMARTLHHPPGPPLLRPAAGNSMSLVLGDVILRVAPSSRYVLSADGNPFLQLDLHRGLAVTCVAGAHNHAATGITQNSFPYRWADVRPSSPDSHTLLVQQEGADIFRARYSEPWRIEVMGQFFERRSAGSPLMSFENGITWNGGHVAPGTVIDLTQQGQGKIDFGPGGVIRIRS